MSQVELMLGVKISIPIPPGIEVVVDFPAMVSPRQGTDDRRPAVDGYPAIAAAPGTETSPDIDVEKKLKEAFARGWSVIVWNDPVNLMDYVVYVFKAVLKMNEQDASRHMWEVHQKGKSQVARETREKSELIVHRLRGFGLNATMEQA
jgi:ATP-dependent Clp protease adaptor protein ClpS